jgi:hypothetical protein
MPKCTKCGTRFHGARCPACGESAPISAKILNKQLEKYSYPLFAGFVGIIIADYAYPPLDENPPMILALCLFLVPILLHIVVSVRRRFLDSFSWLRLVYIYSGSAAIVIATVLGLNGMADFASARNVQTSVTRKYISSGRYSTSYHLVVSSWRPGRSEEKLRVSGATYHATFVGEPVVVEAHRGLFALPWYGRVSPE